ncbi:MAG TPA: DUF2167 domain-containing protein [Tahibacter sp.]|uniref:DUF2167 domain-containing protein n=1 Tax=Tahibacter sp. TaxID=2056211 RepID=UPI002BB0E958|nr:DUF2167 domain-containing protein [Tahibacter sp.]HSX61497.1 DUF2167 domain-containing protein [Tahibacter sp.]
MKIMLIGYALSLMFVLLMVVRVWRASALDGILTLLLPFYFIVAMIKYWNEPDHNIRFHVLGMLVCSGIAYYGATRVAKDMLGTPEERQALVQAMREDGDKLTPEQEKGLLSDDPEVVLRTMQQIEEQNGGVEYSDESGPGGEAAVDTQPRDAEFDNPRPVAAQERPVETLSYAEAARRAVFNRGTYTRDAIGVSIDVPSKFRLISATDARRLDQSRGRTEDPRGLAWIIHERLSLADPDAWHVTARWHSDGWVGAAPLDGPALLDAALANKTPAPRVMTSQGDLVGYAAAPQFDGQVIDWVEERVLANSDEQVVDCHAVRLGRRGVLEFSIVGMPTKSTALCHETVRLIAQRSSFLPGKEYPPAAPAEGLRASYTIAALASHAR